MIKHVVMFKLKSHNAQSMDEAISCLEGMRGKIETLKYIEVGADITHSERSFDIVLITHFDNREGLNKYSAHPLHKPVLESMRNLCSSIMAVDYDSTR